MKRVSHSLTLILPIFFVLKILSDCYVCCIIHVYSNELQNTFYPQYFYTMNPGLEVIKLFSYSTQLSTKFFLLINVKMPTIVGILTFISMIFTTSERLKARSVRILV